MPAVLQEEPVPVFLLIAKIVLTEMLVKGFRDVVAESALDWQCLRH